MSSQTVFLKAGVERVRCPTVLFQASFVLKEATGIQMRLAIPS